MPDIQPYDGPIQTTPEHFARAYPELEAVAEGKRRTKGLDPKTVEKMEALHRQMRMNPPKPATVINMHPFPLKVNGGHLFAGIEVPACNPGEPFAFKHIRGYKWDWKEEEDGSVTPMPIFPIELAREFVREFNGDNAQSYGSGVICYEGDGNPLKMGEVEVYDDRGQLVTEDRVVVEEAPEGTKEKHIRPVPIKKKLSELMSEVRQKRNEKYFKRVQDANHDYNLPNGAGKRNITDHHLLFARVLKSEGVIRELPQWNLENKSTEGYEVNDCPVCAEPRRTSAIVCKGCNYVYDPLKAYELSIIEYGNLAMERMTADEWEQAEAIKAERDASRAKVADKQAPKTKAKNPNKGDD